MAGKNSYSATDVTAAILRVCDALDNQQKVILELDQAIGDGDLGITVAKISTAMREFVKNSPMDDLGKFLASAGMEANRVGSSTMGTLIATGLMRAGKEAKGLSELTPQLLGAMLQSAATGMQERGKANLGDKTVLDAIFPAAEAFNTALQANESLKEAGIKMVKAAELGRDAVTPLVSKIGRASWQQDRTAGQVDPGCAALVIILRALAGC